MWPPKHRAFGSRGKGRDAHALVHDAAGPEQRHDATLSRKFRWMFGGWTSSYFFTHPSEAGRGLPISNFCRFFEARGGRDLWIWVRFRLCKHHHSAWDACAALGHGYFLFEVSAFRWFNACNTWMRTRLLLVLPFILLTLKWDGDTSFSWAVVFIPIWKLVQKVEVIIHSTSLFVEVTSPCLFHNSFWYTYFIWIIGKKRSVHFFVDAWGTLLDLAGKNEERERERYHMPPHQRIFQLVVLCPPQRG